MKSPIVIRSKAFPWNEPTIKNRLNISMCWDGKTKTATLTINGNTLTGEPNEVQECFDALNKLRDDDWTFRHHQSTAFDLLEQAQQLLVRQP